MHGSDHMDTNWLYPFDWERLAALKEQKEHQTDDQRKLSTIFRHVNSPWEAHNLPYIPCLPPGNLERYHIILRQRPLKLRFLQL